MHNREAPWHNAGDQRERGRSWLQHVSAVSFQRNFRFLTGVGKEGTEHFIKLIRRLPAQDAPDGLWNRQCPFGA